MNMQEFMTKLTADQALAEKMSKAANPEEAYGIAKEAGLTESFDTFVDTMKKLYDASGDMSSKELDEITGGTSTSQVVGYAMTAAQTVALLVGAAMGSSI